MRRASARLRQVQVGEPTCTSLKHLSLRMFPVPPGSHSGRAQSKQKQVLEGLSTLRPLSREAATQQRVRDAQHRRERGCVAGWPRPEPDASAKRTQCVKPARACGKCKLENQHARALSTFPCACFLSRRTHTRGEPKASESKFWRNSQPSDPSRARRQPNSECTVHNADGSGGVWQGGQGLNPTTAGRSVEPARACGKSLLENPTRASLKHFSLRGFPAPPDAHSGRAQRKSETINGGGTLNPRTPRAQWRQPNSKCKSCTVLKRAEVCGRVAEA